MNTDRLVKAIVQARMSSLRFPGKVLKPIGGRPVLGHVIDRLKNAKLLDDIIIATSTERDDDQIVGFAERNNIKVYRGSINNVLRRFVDCAGEYGAEVVVRVCGDSPFIDPQIVDKFVYEFLKSKSDYLSCYSGNIPHGFECEVISFAALKKSLGSAKTKNDLEHVSWFVLSNKDKFKVKLIDCGKKNEYRDVYFTVDYPEDLKFLNKLYQFLSCKGKSFSTDDIFSVLDGNKGLLEINKHVMHSGTLRK